MTHQHLDRPGHLCMPDGSLLRLDCELGRFVASHYSPSLTLLRYRRGSLEAMRTLVNQWAHDLEDACACRRPKKEAS